MVMNRSWLVPVVIPEADISKMATTFGDAKIRVNCIAPGIFPSEMTAGSSGDDQKSKLEIEMSNPAGRAHTLFMNLYTSEP